MDHQDLDTILKEWKVDSSSERWSLKAMFLNYHPGHFTAEDFVNFLTVKLGDKPRKYIWR